MLRDDHEHVGGSTVDGAPDPDAERRPIRRPPIPSLDGLRAVAVLIVLVSHVGYGSQVPGGLGVTIFFFLSGYLITTLLLDEHGDWGRIDVRQFYLRRAFRLLPPLFVTLAVAYGLLAVGRIGGGFTWGGLLSQVFYFANYHAIFFDSGASTPAGTGILWSLAVEEHFYILYPLVIVLLLRWSGDRRRIGLLFAALTVATLAWRIWLVSRPGFVEVRTYYATDTRFDSILFGCILALRWNPVRPSTDPGSQAPSDRSMWYLFGAGCTLLLSTIAIRDDTFRETARYSLQGLALMPIFYAAMRTPARWPFRLLNTRTLARLGVLSYGIYLSHFIVIEVVNSANPDVANPVRLAIALAGAVAFAEFLDRLIDPYFRRRRAALRPG